MVGVCWEVRDFENTIGFQPLFLGDKKLAYYNTTKPLLISAVSASLSLWSLDRRHCLSSFHLVFMRKLKFHEQKLLKKVDFLQWKSDRNIREIKVLRRYLLQNRDDYAKYDKLAGLIKKLTARLKTLDPSDEFRMKMTEQLLNKLYSMGVINAKTSLAKTESVTVSAFCRRRLPVVMVRLKMSQTLSQAATFIEQGHVRVGPHAVTDPAYLVTRSMEDFVTWVDSSKIKRTIKTYEDKLDDFDLLGEG